VSDPEGPDPLGDAWNDVPLFREIQRVLQSSSGPVNWELARQVAVANANGEGGSDPEPNDADVHSLQEAVRVAELQVAGFTGLDAPSDVASVEGVRRAVWIQRNVDGLRPLIEPAATRIGEAVTRAQTEALPDVSSAEQLMPGLSQLMGQMSPLLLGAQIGTVLGALGQEALGQYDIALPRSDGAHSLLFVVENIATFERDWSLDPTEFRTWVATHEVTHRFAFSRGWVFGHLRSLLDDYLSTLRFDIEGMQRRLEGIDASNPEAIQEVLGSEEGLFGTMMDDEQRLKLRRIQAFMAAVEGYADHVVHAVGGKLLRTSGRIEEAMLRYRESERVDPVLERMLGVEVEREWYARGKAFCDAVAEATDEPTLSRMWEDAEALPSLPEIEEPRLWLARTV
jgi:putative hydrolase